MTRRALLASLAAAFVLDPERLLWKPGARLISVPAPPFLKIGDICTFSDNPERFIVTMEARSLVMIGEARFRVLIDELSTFEKRRGLPMSGLYTSLRPASIRPASGPWHRSFTAGEEH